MEKSSGKHAELTKQQRAIEVDILAHELIILIECIDCADRKPDRSPCGFDAVPCACVFAAHSLFENDSAVARVPAILFDSQVGEAAAFGESESFVRYANQIVAAVGIAVQGELCALAECVHYTVNVVSVFGSQVFFQHTDVRFAYGFRHLFPLIRNSDSCYCTFASNAPVSTRPSRFT